MTYTSLEIHRGNQNLLELANYVERRQRAKPKKGYNQRELKHACGAPACLLGHLHASGGEVGIASISMFSEEYDKMFGPRGCNNAGKDWRKAVAYVRKFVADRERKLGIGKHV